MMHISQTNIGYVIINWVTNYSPQKKIWVISRWFRLTYRYNNLIVDNRALASWQTAQPFKQMT